MSRPLKFSRFYLSEKLQEEDEKKLRRTVLARQSVFIPKENLRDTSYRSNEKYEKATTIKKLYFRKTKCSKLDISRK